MSPQIVVTRNIGDKAHAQLEALGAPFLHNRSDESWRQEELIEKAQGATAVICLLSDQMDGDVMDRLPDLRLIANVAVGYDNVDVDAASQRGILVTNTPDVLTETTADLAFALLLAIARRIPESDAYMRAGNYQRFELFPEMLGVDVYGKTLGIVGLGRIGTAVAKRGAHGFDMPILYSGRSRYPEKEAQLNGRYVSFDELLAQSDFISINVSLNDETRHLFDKAAFQKMKPTACLVNTARGPVVKESDLLWALREEEIRGAALDVFEFEPEMVAGLAEIHDRLVVAPHIGSATIETRQKMAQIAVDNVAAILRGKRPLTPVNEEQIKRS